MIYRFIDISIYEKLNERLSIRYQELFASYSIFEESRSMCRPSDNVSTTNLHTIPTDLIFAFEERARLSIMRINVATNKLYLGPRLMDQQSDLQSRGSTSIIGTASVARVFLIRENWIMAFVILSSYALATLHVHIKLNNCDENICVSQAEYACARINFIARITVDRHAILPKHAKFYVPLIIYIIEILIIYIIESDLLNIQELYFGASYSEKISFPHFSPSYFSFQLLIFLPFLISSHFFSPNKISVILPSIMNSLFRKEFPFLSLYLFLNRMSLIIIFYSFVHSFLVPLILFSPLNLDLIFYISFLFSFFFFFFAFSFLFLRDYILFSAFLSHVLKF